MLDLETSFSILPLIKDSQIKHGLKYGDYLSYRKYCTRKIKRIKKKKNLVVNKDKGKNNLKKNDLKFKTYTFEDFGSASKCLEYFLFKAERCWSQYMEFKFIVKTFRRKRFHMIQRLKKSEQYSKKLLDFGELCTNSFTKLEIRAYNMWMNGSLSMEYQKWQEAITHYNTSKEIYNQLCKLMSVDKVHFYENMITDIDHLIKFCSYNIGENPSKDDITNKLSTISPLYFDYEISSKVHSDSNMNDQVNFFGTILTINDAKIKKFLKEFINFEKLDISSNIDQAFKIFDDLLLSSKESRQILSNSLKNSTNKDIIQLNSYLEYINNKVLLKRNIFLFKSIDKPIYDFIDMRTQSIFDKSSGASSNLLAKSLIKCEDGLRICDSIKPILNELIAVCQHDNSSKSLLEKVSQYLESKRLFILSLLFHRESQQNESSSSLNHSYEILNSISVDEQTEYSNDISILKDYIVKLAKIYSVTSMIQRLAMDNRNLILFDGDSTPNKSNLKNKVSIKSSNVLYEPNIEFVNLKPIFYDLAFNSFDLSNLKIHQSQNQNNPSVSSSGLSGFVKSIFWGKK